MLQDTPRQMHAVEITRVRTYAWAHPTDNTVAFVITAISNARMMNALPIVLCAMASRIAAMALTSATVWHTNAVHADLNVNRMGFVYQGKL